MRYQNWDVLLFPADSKIPIQEFDTKCYALEQNGRASSLQAIDGDRNSYESMTVLPTLTCFVASLDRGSSFRVSIHSWEKPKPSDLLLSYKTPEEVVLFEAKVYIDGILMAQRTFEDGVWPEVIADREGGPHRLRFPSFHKEVLQQPHWEPGDPVGRIRLVLSEGVLRETTPPAPSAAMFDRFRDVVTFSFQHAPQNVLEYSGIAWPNMRLFGKVSKRSMRPPPISSRLPPVPGHEAHSHSPRRTAGAINGGRPSSDEMEAFQKLLNVQTFSDLQSDPVSRSGPFTAMRRFSPESRGSSADCEDPFLSAAPISTRQWRAQVRSSSHDIPMLDYNSNNSGAPTEMSGLSFPGASFLKHMNQANPQEIIQALCPERKEQLLKALGKSQNPAHGTQPPTTTPLVVTDRSRAHSLADPTVAALSTGRQSNISGEIGADSWARNLPKHEYSERHSSARSSLGSRGDKDRNFSKIDISPKRTQASNDKARRSSLVPPEVRSSSGCISRPRSSSNASKRKRRSLSPSIAIGTPVNKVPVVIDSPSNASEGEKDLGLTRDTPTPSDGGMPLQVG
ncbi:2-isopropylmalate synthase (Alpha-isopropylmalate synthase) (Alpha-IPM synthetase) [Exophiala xenobiotica]|nr:2-isopropylmalate synthase (Alpha-isopropylmalate synthase) (Alpha-IPM synthetase) [Exophiala xenobiotica]KAK5236502.1 2-isopropylmalate synthase (Alpha-isopropylmalate synthase) (Alpha-IPM synthetase) [Exophiala xenobiotica]KAK5252270.1 2-isopropylmalate synthase (Alpha-isopropylmalate synthase) (Alpha-IPM synthetase) [Exophiala xenobiotica]KAK5323285.1 2-isopropylmalate synthase (Alpha-isopropylmalate synthase) (Alpha-IPM synthetase) [Exophiala xenobiotica]KAK5350612.1 2-isopropylmalate sy